MRTGTIISALVRRQVKSLGTARFGSPDIVIALSNRISPDCLAMNESVTQIKDLTGNPAPLGLLGFGMTTVLLNLHNAGLYELNSMILAMGICYGGTAQIIAGIMEWRKGNTFATTAFLSYGLFWFSLVMLIIVAKLGWASPSNDTAMAAYLGMWGLFTAVMFIGTLQLSRALQIVFATLTILFFLLAIGHYTSASAGFKHFTGYEGILCGFSAIYAGLAQVLNEVFGKVVLPLGPVEKGL
jgi:succinate-acetate transporter protein